MIEFSCREATAADVDELAELNRQLIEDEQSRNSWNKKRLAERISFWVENERFKIVVAIHRERIIAYLVYVQRPDEYEEEQTAVFMRQYFVVRDLRNQGLGKKIFTSMSEQFFAQGVTLWLDVLEHNERAQKFWSDLGFATYSRVMRK